MKKFIISVLSVLIFISLVIIVLGGFELFNHLIGNFGSMMTQTGKDLIGLLKPLFIFGLIAGFPIYATILLLGLGKGANATSHAVIDLSEEIMKAKKKKGKPNA